MTQCVWGPSVLFGLKKTPRIASQTHLHWWGIHLSPPIWWYFPRDNRVTAIFVAMLVYELYNCIFKLSLLENFLPLTTWRSMKNKVLTLRALGYKLSLAPGTRNCHNEAALLQVFLFCLHLLISLGSPYFKIEACSFHTSLFYKLPEKVGVMVWKMFFHILFPAPWGKSWLKRMGEYPPSWHQGVLEAKSKMQIRDSLFFLVFQECQVKINAPGFKKIFFRHFMSLPLQKL